MSVEVIASHIESFAQYAESAPLLILLFIFLFMAVESSFIPFPSEVVMIPAGFLLFRYPLPTGIHWLDFLIVVLAGLAGSLLGAYVNYFLAAKLGKPFLRKYGKYVLLSEKALDRADEIFLKYGDMVTFVCRLLPAIRQIISIPAGISGMDLKRFSFFTGLGAGIWSAILAAIGYFLGYSVGEMTYLEMVQRGKQMLHDHFIWVILGIVVIVGAHMAITKFIMKSDKTKTETECAE
ncbi:MAG: DedA family protein [Lentisphaeria bacterium]|nr:DedA family protein [Lentisphaeria bacterium]